MYSKQKASQLRKNFWTSFGQYMRPLRNADDETVNWLNYKTGVNHLYFRMDADSMHAGIGVEFCHADPSQQQYHFEKFRQLESLFHETMGEKWEWRLHTTDDDGKLVSRISRELDGVNIFNTQDWQTIISFLKQRIIALDIFWRLVKERFE